MIYGGGGMTLGQKLKQARLARGMTQSQVVGDRITRNMLSQIENDLASPSVGTLEYLASVLNVRLSWLLADEEEEAEAARTQRLRECLKNGDYSGCLALAPEHAPDDEQALALALAAAQCTWKALEAERFDTARHLARQALAWNAGSLYQSVLVGLDMRAALVRCAQNAGPGTQSTLADCRFAYDAVQAAQSRYHLTMARCAIGQADPDEAARELAAAGCQPEERAELLILRGRLAAAQGRYEEAIGHLRQAEAIGPLPRLLERELLQTMELASRELQDYKTAYEYAARQLKL